MTPIPWHVQARAERLVLELRELLVRMDENEKAWRLLDPEAGCVPYFIQDSPRIARAAEEQKGMVRHLLHPSAYTGYYETNQHERPFEEQYRPLTAATAHEGLPRVAWLRGRLEERFEAQHSGSLLDLACNDGWMIANLRQDQHVSTAMGVDLSPACILRARQRGITHARFKTGRAEDPGLPPGDLFDTVTVFEVIEHVADPHALLAAACRHTAPGGRVCVSTPDGCVTGGDLPAWDLVEPKGHVRAYTAASFQRVLERHGRVEQIALGPDGVLLAELTPETGGSSRA